jgi:hypothetical protein
MDGINTSMDSLETSVKRLASAVDALEWATDLRMRHDEARASTQEEFALMQDDRSRLAVELDAAVDRSARSDPPTLKQPIGSPMPLGRLNARSDDRRRTPED